MSEIEARSQPQKTKPPGGVAKFPDPVGSAPPRRRILPLLITIVAVALALWLGWAMWDVYMAAPWTRDGTVRAYIVTMAPEVEGRIVELPVVDNQLVHKGELLMLIDPTNYKIAVRQAEAALSQAQASAANIDAQINVQQAQITASEAQVEQSQAALTYGKQQAQRYQHLAHEQFGTVQLEQESASTLREDRAGLKNTQAALAVAQRQIDALQAQRSSAEAMIAQANAQLDQARVNLERTRIVSPVNGYVTNLLAQLGDYANVGQNKISLVNADSFWVDGYFEETILGPVRVGDPAEIKLMGYDPVLRGHVDSIARAINVANAQPNGQGVATVNPIFTWVRLAQRIPVRIHIDEVPKGVTLAAGMTATVHINRRPASPEQ
ncbi:MAG TPA: HlyD family secretion protein [Dongiaceae bacterium]|nr:HlyD family secretion protein [Dongiaceae bacterium]